LFESSVVSWKYAAYLHFVILSEAKDLWNLFAAPVLSQVPRQPSSNFAPNFRDTTLDLPGRRMAEAKRKLVKRKIREHPED